MGAGSAGRRLRRRIGSWAWRLQGRPGIAAVGHRQYIGGRWDEIGSLQFDFMVDRGLRPPHVLLDIACGSLRGGVHFIPYLDPGNYLGIDREKALIDSGLAEELPAAVREAKRPEFVVSSSFEFERFSKPADYSLAQSLFTHLASADIELCLGHLRDFVAPGHQLYATFYAGESERNRSRSHSRSPFLYAPAELEEIAGERWKCELVGDWGHPRGQQMMKFLAG